MTLIYLKPESLINREWGPIKIDKYDTQEGYLGLYDNTAAQGVTYCI